MEPCKRADQAPVALSMPHFYQADPIYRERVGGMTPDKEKHQFYMDVVPQFGFPLAIRPRFQLNVVISGEQNIFLTPNRPLIQLWCARSKLNMDEICSLNIYL